MLEVIIFMLMIFFCFVLGNSKWTKSALATGAMALALGVSLAGCGGGGGTTNAVTIPVAGTVKFEAGNSDSHVAYDLKPATKYYWKVIANDNSLSGLRFESMRNEFTTADI